MTLLFIHGAGGTGETFARQLDAFPQAHAPDLPGHRTAGAPESIGDFCEFIEGYAAEHEIADAVLCGHSMGGAVAIEAALRKRMPIAGIVLLGSGARLRVSPAIIADMENDFHAAAEEVAQYFFAVPSPELVGWAASQMRLVGRDQTVRDFRACDAFDAVGRVGELSVPLLALTGESDRMTPPKFAQAWPGWVPGAQTRIIGGAGHYVMLERPEETNAAVRAFISQLP